MALQRKKVHRPGRFVHPSRLVTLKAEQLVACGASSLGDRAQGHLLLPCLPHWRCTGTRLGLLVHMLFLMDVSQFHRNGLRIGHERTS
jgi:hypothetical protein